MISISRLLIISMSLLLFVGCSSLNEMMGIPTNKGNGYDIAQEKQIYGGGVHIEFQDKEFLESQVKAEMDNRLAREQERKAALDRIPAGGRVIVTYEASTIEGANTKWLEYVVLKDGEEVYRRKGSNSIANVPRSSSGAIQYWWNINVVDLRQPLAPPFDFIVISELDTKRDTFTISKP